MHYLLSLFKLLGNKHYPKKLKEMQKKHFKEYYNAILNALSANLKWKLMDNKSSSKSQNTIIKIHQ